MVRLPPSGLSAKGRRLKAGRRYRTKNYKHYITRHRKGTATVVYVKRSLAADRKKRVGSSRIPRTKTGRLKSGYGHRGDYPKTYRGKRYIVRGHSRGRKRIKKYLRRYKKR